METVVPLLAPRRVSGQFSGDAGEPRPCWDSRSTGAGILLGREKKSAFSFDCQPDNGK